MLFHALREALLNEIRNTIRSGAFTERSLARFLGVSQPHLHNVLNGSRALTFHLGDHIITKLDIPWDSLLAHLQSRPVPPKLMNFDECYNLQNEPSDPTRRKELHRIDARSTIETK